MSVRAIFESNPNWIIIEFKNLIQTVKEWKDSLFFYLISFFYISKLKNREQPSINLSQIYRSIDDDLNNPDDSKKFQKSFPFLSSKVTPYLPLDNSIYEKKGAVNATSPQWFRYRATW